MCLRIVSTNPDIRAEYSSNDTFFMFLKTLFKDEQAGLWQNYRMTEPAQ